MGTSNKDSRILIVDDTQKNIQVLGTVLRKEDYQINVAQNGLQALESVEKVKPDLILLDVMMPELDGFETCKRLKESSQTKDIPVIFLTAKTETEDIVKGFELGGVDYVTKPFNTTELLVRVNTHLTLYHLQMKLEQRVAERTEELSEALDEVVEAHQQTNQAHLETIYRLSVAAEYRDEDTGDHIVRMSRYSFFLAQKLELPEDETILVFNASPMHDIGKIGIPDEILLKPGKLTDEEFKTMMEHAVIGSRILSGSTSELLQAGEAIALTHHEKWNGSGYPNGLEGEGIPLWGRICAVADVFDALTSQRPYKKAFPNEKALEIMKEGRETHFDPKILDLFIENFSDITSIQEEVAKQQ